MSQVKAAIEQHIAELTEALEEDGWYVVNGHINGYELVTIQTLGEDRRWHNDRLSVLREIQTDLCYGIQWGEGKTEYHEDEFTHKPVHLWPSVRKVILTEYRTADNQVWATHQHGSGASE